MEGLVELLGESLLTYGGTQARTADLLAGKGAVALYFCAHWAPPCRSFTPELAKWYEAGLKDKGLEVVLVSSDKDEAAFDESFLGQMPWLALPWGVCLKRREELSRKYKVKGLPSLVILDPSGEVITKDGRSAMASDPTGEEFPWRPKSLREILAGAKIVSDCAAADGSEVLEDRVLGIFFGAGWDLNCKQFAAQLAEWYSKDLKDKGFEVLFVSSDNDKASFKEFYGEMPWLALDFLDRRRKEQLTSLFEIKGLPSLVVVDKNGSTITKNGRGVVGGDPTGSTFPWFPEPVSELHIDPAGMNHTPTVIAFCDACDADARTAAVKAMEPVAARLLAEAKAAGEELPKVAFQVATCKGGLTGRLRGMMGMPDLPPERHLHPLTMVPSMPNDGWGCDGCGKDGAFLLERFTCSAGCDFDYCPTCHEKAGTSQQVPPQLMLIDIPDNGGFSVGPEGGGITAEEVEKFAEKYLANKLVRHQLRG